jgi:molybdenum cofactor cytidylyltransferase
MGRPKLLLPWGATSVLGHQIAVWKELCAAQVCVVHAKEDAGMQAELDRLAVPVTDCITNPHPEQGMFSSIRCAATWEHWLSDLSHIVISLGDQPHLRVETLKRALDFAKQHRGRICQPSYAGHMRHPVILPIDFFRQLRDTNAATLKEFLAANPTASVEVDDPGLNLDIDQPADYEQALLLARRAK